MLVFNLGEIMKIYLASPLFNEMELENIGKVLKILRGRGFEVFAPYEVIIEEKDNAKWAKEIFEIDRNAIKSSDAVVLLYYGLYSDSGTAWECGFAHALNKPVIVVHCQKEKSNSLMVVNGCKTNLSSIEELDTFNFNTFESQNEFVSNTAQA